MRGVVAVCLAMLAGLWLGADARAESPADAFKRGQEDAKRLLERLFGGGGRQAPSAGDELARRRDTARDAYSRGEYENALSMFDALLVDVARQFGPRSREYAAILGYKASILQDTGRYDLAEPLYREALAITAGTEGTASPYYAADLQNLADLQRVTGYFGDTLRTLEQSEAIGTSGTGAEHKLAEARSLASQGEVLRQLGQLKKAEDVLTRAIRAAQQSGRQDGDVVSILVVAIANRALVRMDDGRPGEALASLDQMLGVLQQNGLQNRPPAVLLGGHRVAALLLLGRLQEAEAQARATRDLGRALLGASPALTAKFDALLGVVLVKAGKTAEGAALLRGVITALVEPSRALADQFLPKVEEERFHRLYVAALAETFDAEPSDADMSLFLTAVSRLTQSSAGYALRQIALRAAAQDAATAERVRSLQDVEAAYVANRNAALAGTVPRAKADSDFDGLVERRNRLIADIEQRFPAFRALAQQTDVVPRQVREALGPGEVLVWVITLKQPIAMFADTFIWIATRDRARLVRSTLSSAAIEREVAALRCGLDITVWRDASQWADDTERKAAMKTEQQARRARCLAEAKYEPQYDDENEARIETLPFDRARAHALYRGLFGPAEAMLAGRAHLLFVPSGAMAGLPPRVLVRTAPQNEGGWQADYLGRQIAVTILPSISSVLDLQQLAPSRAPKPYAAFANPLLRGDPAALAQAQARIGCAPTPAKISSALRASRSNAAPTTPASGIIDHNELATRLTALPDTADEVCGVARAAGADPGEIRLGARATETEIKGLSAATSGPRLSDYRILHFATHGLLAGELTSAAEPGLALTPPATASELDDGYLSASEVAGLRLNADWVVLSACNTAGPAGQGHGGLEALSGLARAFIHSQARALLVSHWVVDSRATEVLISATLQAHAQAPAAGRAAAHRQAITAFIDSGLHPALWAPFVVVGEGRAGR